MTTIILNTVIYDVSKNHSSTIYENAHGINSGIIVDKVVISINTQEKSWKLYDLHVYLYDSLQNLMSRR